VGNGCICISNNRVKHSVFLGGTRVYPGSPVTNNSIVADFMPYNILSSSHNAHIRKVEWFLRQAEVHLYILAKTICENFNATDFIIGGAEKHTV